MLTLFHIGAAGYWSGATIQAADDAVVPSGWTARPVPELQPGEFAQLTAEGWQTTTTPPAAQVVAAPEQLPELVVIAIEPDADHAAGTHVRTLGDVTCPVGAVIHMRAELRSWQQELGLTFVHVTHSQEEAMALADLMVVMNHREIARLYLQEAQQILDGFRVVWISLAR